MGERNSEKLGGRNSRVALTKGGVGGELWEEKKIKKKS